MTKSNSKQAKKFLVKGEMLTVVEASEKYGLKASTVRNRMYSKELSLEEAIFHTPKKVIANKGSKEWQNLKGEARIKPGDI